MFMDRVHKKRNSRTRTLSSHLDKISLGDKDLLHEKRTLFSCGTQRVVPSGQDSAMLPARVANQSAGFGSSCTLRELAIK